MLIKKKNNILQENILYFFRDLRGLHCLHCAEIYILKCGKNPAVVLREKEDKSELT